MLTNLKSRIIFSKILFLKGFLDSRHYQKAVSDPGPTSSLVDEKSIFFRGRERETSSNDEVFLFAPGTERLYTSAKLIDEISVQMIDALFALALLGFASSSSFHSPELCSKNFSKSSLIVSA